MDREFTWLPFYQEFADRLLEYQNDRPALVQKVVKVFKMTGMRQPTLEKDNELEDIDPFTIFALFNKGITDANRRTLISGFRAEFQIQAPVPADFDGIPLVNILSATFYYFKEDRQDGDIAHLWDVFSSALALAAEETDTNRQHFIQSYDTVLKQRGVRWNITMGLYWIRPHFFISLDSRNRKFLSEPSNMFDETVRAAVSAMKSPPSGEAYLAFLTDCRAALRSETCDFSSFPELSYRAWCFTDGEKPPSGAGTGPDGEVPTVHYWLYSPGEGAAEWESFYEKGVMGLGWKSLGDLSAYPSKDAITKALKESLGGNSSYRNTANATWQFVHDLKQGDIILAKRGRSEIIGRGVVTSDYSFDSSISSKYPNIRSVQWTDRGSWPIDESLALKTLTDISNYPNLVAKINSLFPVTDDDTDGGPDVPPGISDEYPAYTQDQFLEQVYIGEDAYQTLVGVLKNKKNIILQGAPGVGKTFVAKRLAYSIMGVMDINRVKMVQFHQSYSYEDFIMGIRPSQQGYVLKTGAFYNFCKLAQDDSDNDYFFIIDEINRGNLSKIFGELFMLIENDKRGSHNKLQLLYSDELFYVPENLYIIGMMNTADRSLALLDYALRRRFAFFDLKPAFSSEGFRAYQASLNSPRFDKLIRCVQSLNEQIARDESLGDGFCIGHSYFCNLTTDSLTDAVLSGIVEYELIPMLKEYWFDEPYRVREWSDNLRGALR